MQLAGLIHPFHTERLIRIETQINVGFLRSHGDYNADLNPGSRPAYEVVLNPHSPVNLELIAFLFVFNECWHDGSEQRAHWSDTGMEERRKSCLSRVGFNSLTKYAKVGRLTRKFPLNSASLQP